MSHICKILALEQATLSVYRLLIEKPSGFRFVPGHSIMVSVDKPELRGEKHPLTFTSTNLDSHLEFHVKAYPKRQSFNNILVSLQPGDSLVLAEMFGTIRYAGPGLFLAGGIGIAPFLAILRQLKLENTVGDNALVYSTSQHADVLAENELRQIFGERLHVTLTKETRKGYGHGRITPALIASLFHKIPKNIYAIGSETFVADMRSLFAPV